MVDKGVQIAYNQKKPRRGYQMKGRLMVKCFLMLFVVSICFVAFPDLSAAQQKVITLNYSNFFPAPHKNSQLADAWCKEIEKRTNGK